TWFDRAGTSIGAIADADSYESVAISPDGGPVLFRAGSPSSGARIWIADLGTRAQTRLTFGTRDNLGVWSPDGKRALVTSQVDGVASVFERNVDGTGAPASVFKSDRNAFVNDWSRDGRWALVTLPRHVD